MRSVNVPVRAVSKLLPATRAMALVTARMPGFMRLLGAIFVLAICVLPLRADQSITVRSGNGTIGSQDSKVRFLAFGAYGAITPTAAQLLAVESGTFAYINQAYPTYIQSLPSDSSAQWVATTPSLGAGSALYSIPFTVTDSDIASASLDLGYAVDNAIDGVYINGTLVSGDSTGGDFSAEYYVMRTDIASMLKPNAVNWLCINVNDGGVFSGLIFSATITTEAVPNNGTTTTIAVNPNVNLVAGEPITLTATVVPDSGSGVPTGTVTFTDPAGGSATLPLDGTGKAVYSGKVPPVGTYSVFAKYNGAAGFTKSVSATITRSVAAAN